MHLLAAKSKPVTVSKKRKRIELPDYAQEESKEPTRADAAMDGGADDKDTGGVLETPVWRSKRNKTKQGPDEAHSLM